MEDLSERLSKLGRAIADADSPDSGTLADARRRFVRGGRDRARARRLLPALSLAAAAVFGVTAFVATRQPRDVTPEAPIDFVVGESREDGRVGQWIAAGDTELPLRFSEGTSIAVRESGRARVSSLSSAGASVDLERGRLTADVAHTGRAEWTFRAGPYTVRVTGTRFDLVWDDRNEALTVHMHEGSVEVGGPRFARPHTVVAGQVFRSSDRGRRVELAAAPADGEHDRNEAAPREQLVEPMGSARVETTEPGRPSDRRVAPAQAEDPIAAPNDRALRQAEWRSLLDRRAHADAVAAAEREGFGRVLSSAEPLDLYRLADAARLVGRPDRAREALVALRARHGERGRTAFLLGRIAHETGDRTEAARWLETHLREAPGGPLEEPALGRLIELERGSDPASARARAEDYLARFPNGAYADLARAVVNR